MRKTIMIAKVPNELATTIFLPTEPMNRKRPAAI
jgi:hypothetical protein